MSETVTTIHWESSSGEATPKLLKKGKHHLPVIDNKDQLVGITSSMNTLAEFADSPPV